MGGCSGTTLRQERSVNRSNVSGNYMLIKAAMYNCIMTTVPTAGTRVRIEHNFSTHSERGRISKQVWKLIRVYGNLYRARDSKLP